MPVERSRMVLDLSAITESIELGSPIHLATWQHCANPYEPGIERENLILRNGAREDEE